MNKQHHVIYIPGLGDYKSSGQIYVLKLWRTHGLRVHYLPVGWGSSRSFDSRLKQVTTTIDELKAQGHKVYLVGVSAGASAVINAFAERPEVDRVVYICGKIQNPQTIAPWIYRRNPAFRQSMARLPKSLAKLSRKDRLKILSVRPLHDSTVPVGDTKIKGVREKILPLAGHIQAIAFAITISSRSIAKFLKSE